MTELNVNKNCTYNGKYFIDFRDAIFICYPTTSIKQCAIYYEIDKDDDNEKLLLKITQSYKGRQTVTLTLLKTDYLLKNDEIMVIHIDTQSLSNISFQPEYEEFQKTVQIKGGYTLIRNEGIVEVNYVYNNGAQHTVMVNPESNVLGIYLWLSGVWPVAVVRGCCCLVIGDDIIDDTATFSDYINNDKVSVKVTEKCYIGPITEDNEAIVVPWNRNKEIMVRCLAAHLKVDSRRVVLVDHQKRVLDDVAQLDVDKYRDGDVNYSPVLYYDMTDGTKIRCWPMQIDQPPVDVMIVDDLSVIETKKRLAFKLRTEFHRIIICHDNVLLPNEEEVSAERTLKYCLGLSPAVITLKRLIKRGSYGVVYKCTRQSSGDLFALKEFLIPFEELKLRIDIIREFLVMTTLEPHRNIVRYLDLYINDNDIAIAMEYVSQGSLKKYLESKGSLDETEIKLLSTDILHGLQHLHHHKINHRDIKSENILLDANMVAKLCDFGLSKILTDFGTATLEKGIKQTTEVSTFRWMAPEVINGELYGFKADIWSFGATVIEMITGDVPYRDLSKMVVLVKVGNTRKMEFISPYTMSDAMELFVNSCIESDPANRPNVDDLLSFAFLNN